MPPPRPSTTIVPSVTASAAPSVSEEPAPEPDPKWLARLEHGPLLGWGHHGERDVASTLSGLFLSTTTPDPAAVSLAAAVHATSLVVGESAGCGMTWKDVHLLAASPKVRAAAHAFLVRSAGGAKPSPWSNGVYAGERVRMKGSGTLPWDDGGLLGVVYRGDEVVLLRGFQFATGDADCPSLDDIWNKSLTRGP